MNDSHRSVASPRVVNIEDMRRRARARLPRVVFDYLDGGAEGEITLRENCQAFQDVTFRPRQAVAVHATDLRTHVLGHELLLPAMLAPVGYSRLMHPGGEVAAARAAGTAGTGYILSTISGHKLENVRAACSGPVWYQLYLLGGRGAAEAAITRAQAAGFSALVLTVDTAVAGMRERDLQRNEGTAGEKRIRQVAFPAANGGAPQMGSKFPAGRRSSQFAECRDPGARSDAVD